MWNLGYVWQLIKMVFAGANMSAVNCVKCIEPCTRIIYEPVISNAALSSLSIDNILASTPANVMQERKKALSINRDWTVPVPGASHGTVPCPPVLQELSQPDTLHDGIKCTTPSSTRVWNPWRPSSTSSVMISTETSSLIFTWWTRSWALYSVPWRRPVTTSPGESYVTFSLCLCTFGPYRHWLQVLRPWSSDVGLHLFIRGIRHIIPTYQDMVRNVTGSLVEAELWPCCCALLASSAGRE